MYFKKLLIILLIFVFFEYNSAYNCSPCTCETENSVISVSCSYQTTQINENKKINQIPSNIQNYKEIISELDFKDQNFNEINDDLSNFEYTEKLIFSYNKINTIHPGCLKNLTNLKTLRLDNNQIVAIPTKLFKNIKKIEHIYLHDNSITLLQKHLFVNLPNLMEVHLNNNTIERIEDDCFVNVSSLNTLDLSDNKLIILSSNFIDSYDSLTVAYFDKNPWVCDSTLCDLINISLKKKWLRGRIPDCYHPNSNDISQITKKSSNKTGRNWGDLQILKPIEILQFQSPVHVNQSVTLICEIYTCSFPSMLWHFDGNVLENSTHCIEGNKHTVTNILNEVTENDEGYYTCLINNCSFCGNSSRLLTVVANVETTTELLNSSNGIFQLDLGNASINSSVDIDLPDFPCIICLMIGISIGFFIGLVVGILIVIFLPVICCCCSCCQCLTSTQCFMWFINKLDSVVREFQETTPSNTEETPLR